MPDMESLVRAYRNVGPDVPVHMNTGHVKALQRVAAAALQEYAEALRRNKSTEVWDNTDFAFDCDDYADFHYGKDTDYGF